MSENKSDSGLAYDKIDYDSTVNALLGKNGVVVHGVILNNVLAVGF